MDYNNLPQEIFNAEQDNLQKLAALFPAAVKDGLLDIAALKEELGQFEEVTAERYELSWAGKRNAKKASQSDVAGRTLKYIPGDSKDADTTQNLYIEGDNLEVLKLLRQNYYGAVKMIYIDPPYNTGNDFVYRDDFSQSKAASDEAEGETIGGERMVVNQKSGNRFHANWLNMMYPRLRVAKDLLREDGVIFISIDDNEVSQLRRICDEIFWEANFEGHIHWRRRHNQPNDKTKMIGLVAEHILVYAKNSDTLRAAGVGKIDLTGDFSNSDNDPRGDWASKPWKVGSDQSGSRYTITTPSGAVFDEEWMGEETTFKALLEDNRILFPRGGDGMPRKKYFRFEREEEGQCATNWWEHAQFGHNQGANDCVTELFGVKNVFSNPKPIELLRGLIQISNAKNNDIILDFFSGSATTAHSVMQMNDEMRTNLRFLLVQWPEDLDAQYEKSSGKSKAQLKVAIDFLDSVNKPHYITEIGKERIRRAGEKIKAEVEAANAQAKLGEEPKQVPDIGFRVFRTADTNIRWTHEALKPGQVDMDESMLSDKDKLDFMPGYTDMDVVYEVLLRQRDIPLSAKVEKLDIGQRTYLFADAYVVCLDETVTVELAEALAVVEPTPIKYVFRDSAFEDNISLKDETVRRLEAYIARNSGEQKKAYTVEFI